MIVIRGFAGTQRNHKHRTYSHLSSTSFNHFFFGRENRLLWLVVVCFVSSVCQLNNPIKYYLEITCQTCLLGTNLRLWLRNLVVLSDAKFPYFNEGSVTKCLFLTSLSGKATRLVNLYGFETRNKLTEVFWKLESFSWLVYGWKL